MEGKKMKNVTTIEQVKEILVEEFGVKVDVCDKDILIVEDNGVVVQICLTEEEVPRLRFKINLFSIDDSTPENLNSIFLDLNTEIDPIAIGIDTTDPKDIKFQILTTLRVGSLQSEEVIMAFNGLMGTEPVLVEVIKNNKQALNIKELKS